MRARRKWWLIGVVPLAVTVTWLAFALGFACYHKGVHWGSFYDDCNRCNCSEGGVAICTLLACNSVALRMPCKPAVDKLSGKPYCRPCRVHNEMAYDEADGEPHVDVCCEGMGLKVFSPPLNGKPGVGTPICSACRHTGESCNSHLDCCEDEDRCQDFVCFRDPGWRLGQ